MVGPTDRSLQNPRVRVPVCVNVQSSASSVIPPVSYVLASVKRVTPTVPLRRSLRTKTPGQNQLPDPNGLHASNRQSLGSGRPARGRAGNVVGKLIGRNSVASQSSKRAVWIIGYTVTARTVSVATFKGTSSCHGAVNTRFSTFSDRVGIISKRLTMSDRNDRWRQLYPSVPIFWSSRGSPPFSKPLRRKDSRVLVNATHDVRTDSARASRDVVG